MDVNDPNISQAVRNLIGAVTGNVEFVLTGTLDSSASPMIIEGTLTVTAGATILFERFSKTLIDHWETTLVQISAGS